MYIHVHDVHSTASGGAEKKPKPHILYSGKFSRVQNFAESPLRAPEKNFAVFALEAIFAVFIFAEADLSPKTAKFCTTRKFPAIWYKISQIQVAIDVCQYKCIFKSTYCSSSWILRIRYQFWGCDGLNGSFGQDQQHTHTADPTHNTQ